MGEAEINMTLTHLLRVRWRVGIVMGRIWGGEAGICRVLCGQRIKFKSLLVNISRKESDISHIPYT